MDVEKDVVRKALCKAYEEGWRGFAESKDVVVERLLEELASRSKPSPPVITSVSVASQYNSSNPIDPYYYISTMTTEPPESGGRDEVV